MYCTTFYFTNKQNFQKNLRKNKQKINCEVVVDHIILGIETNALYQSMVYDDILAPVLIKCTIVFLKNYRSNIDVPDLLYQLIYEHVFSP